MPERFDIRAERQYYDTRPQDLKITPDHLVEWQMILCTGSPSWPALLHHKRVLAVGAGECSYLKHFLQRATPAVYIAQDIFSERMQIAKNIANYPWVEFIASDVLSLPFNHGYFDSFSTAGKKSFVITIS